MTATVVQDSSVTIDPTFWIAFFAFLGVVVNAVVALKTKHNTEVIAKSVDGAATATLTEMTALRTEIARLQEDRLARADAAPAPNRPAGEPAPEPTEVVVVEALNPLEVHVLKPPKNT